MKSRSLPPLPLIGLGLVLLIAVLTAIFVRPSTSDIEDLFDGGGALGPLLYALAYAVLTIAVFPGAPLTLAAGALYGAVGGTAVSVAGAGAGAIGAFLIARHSTRSSVEQATGKRLAGLEERLEGKGFLALLTLRLVPVVPFNALNYGAGASSIGTRDYVFATLAGIVPGAFAYAAIGAGVDDPLSPLFIGAVVLALGLAVIARSASKHASAPGGDEGSPERSVADPAEREQALRTLRRAAGFFVACLGVFGVLFAVGLFH